MTATQTYPGPGTFPRGVHPPENKELAENGPIEVIPAPKAVAIPLVQHIGAPCQSLITKPKTEVTMGDPVGQAGGFVSSCVHASISGTAGKPCAVTLPTAMHVQAIPIQAADQQPLDGEALLDEVLGGEWAAGDPSQYDPERIIEAVSAAGIVGHGGAAFPTHVKLVRNEARPVDTLVVNGCECEPYLTADYRLMLEFPQPIIAGAILAARACGAERIYVAIEDNKPQAIDRMRRAAAGAAGADIQIAVLKTKYPMGGERQTVRALLNLTVPTGGLPLDVGVVVVNVGTAAAVARAVLRGKPVTHRVVTVTGGGIAQPKNLLAPIGISYGRLIDYCGGMTAEAARVISGGPMMGFAVGDLTTPVTKGTSGVTVLTAADVERAAETACVRCGRCVDVCPLDLVPTKMAQAGEHADWDLARKYHLTACMECGCCGYVCPAGIPLVQLIRTGKARIPKSSS